MSRSPIPRTPLEEWAKGRLGQTGPGPLDLDLLAARQLTLLNGVLTRARERSPFYRERLAGAPERLESLADISLLPFLTARDLREEGDRLLCLSRAEVARIVTLPTSGTTRRPKRLSFTRADLERTVDFFRQGMTTLAEPGWRVMICLPGAAPDSVGDLLAEAVRRMGAEPLAQGPVLDPERAAAEIVQKGADCLVGIPLNLLALAESPAGRLIPPGRIKTVLLSTDYVPAPVSRRLAAAWGCLVLEHYGMTEMGLGGAVQCRALAGFHTRAAELLFEVVDPDTGLPLPPGETGEVVFTTLAREAQPLIRYRTGDLAALLPGACACGANLPRLGKVMGRAAGRVDLGGGPVGMPELDEALLALPGVLDYRARVGEAPGGPGLLVWLRTTPDAPPGTLEAARAALARHPRLEEAAAREGLSVRAWGEAPAGDGPVTGKRLLVREEE